VDDAVISTIIASSARVKDLILLVAVCRVWVPDDAARVESNRTSGGPEHRTLGGGEAPFACAGCVALMNTAERTRKSTALKRRYTFRFFTDMLEQGQLSCNLA